METSQRRVCVIGGTHGNEYTGCWCIKALEQPQVKQQLKLRYPTLAIETLMGNPLAHIHNRRFMEEDLNRQFSVEILYNQDDQDNKNPISNYRGVVNGENSNGNDIPWEIERARELDQYLGPKSASIPRIDVAVDLHSTTSNMGTTLIFPEGDALMAQAAAYIMTQMPQARILLEPLPPQPFRPNVSSSAKHDFTIEVGPVPQGVLRYDVVKDTQTALHYFLEFLNDVDAGRQLLQEACGDTIPCFHTVFPNASPSVKQQRQQQLTGKIPWPSDPENDNFPAWLVHPQIQDQDYSKVRTGDPLFINGKDQSVVCYDGSHGDEIVLIFINEAGYYYASSGTGIGVAYIGKYNIEKGVLVETSSPQGLPVFQEGQKQNLQ